MLGVFAEFETNLRRERQMEGIQAAKARGVYKGRPSSIDASEIRRLLDDGLGASAVANRLGIGRASVYRLTGVERVSRWVIAGPTTLRLATLRSHEVPSVSWRCPAIIAIDTPHPPSQVLPAWTAAWRVCQTFGQQGRTHSLSVPPPMTRDRAAPSPRDRRAASSVVWPCSSINRW